MIDLSSIIRFVILLLFVSSCGTIDSDFIELRIKDNNKVTFGKFTNLSVEGFSEKFDTWYKTEFNAELEKPIIKFLPDPAAKMKATNAVKDVLKRYNTTIRLSYQEKGGRWILYKLPPAKGNEALDFSKLQKRNRLYLHVTNEGLYKDSIRSERITLQDLKGIAYTFIKGSETNEELPKIKEIKFPLIGKEKSSPYHVFIVTHDPNLKYHLYKDLKDCLKETYLQVRDEFSKKHFDKTFYELNEEQSNVIKKITPIVISEV